MAHIVDTELRTVGETRQNLEENDTLTSLTGVTVDFLQIFKV